MEAKLQELRARLVEANDLNSAAALLYWDQATYMPPGGAEARGRQMGTLERLAHEKLIDPAVAKLLDDLRPYEESLPRDGPPNPPNFGGAWGGRADDAALIRVSRRDYEKAARVPPAFTAEFARHASASYEAWTRARPADDFATMEPYLATMVDLSRQYAGFFPGYAHVVDPLIDQADEGFTVAMLQPLFAELRAELVPLVQALTAKPPADDACLRRHYPEAQQWAFGLQMAKRFGYDLERGRQDKTHHPFMTKFSLGDVRITNRVDEHHLGVALFSTLHEAGHALYEQGIDRAFEGTPLAEGASSGVHESQSRLWENLVGRSAAFWRFAYPELQAVFPDQLGSVPREEFVRAINRVARSLVRVDADEVTYNLHVMIRFDLELALLEGRLAVHDLPEAWRERYRQDLGVVPPDHRDGVLQDMHWYSHFVGGAFQGYTLGNILAAQLFEAAQRDHPAIPDEIARGEFDTLRAWLTERLYRHGRKYPPAETVERAAGGPLSIEPYVRYLKSKYGELYSI